MYKFFTIVELDKEKVSFFECTYTLPEGEKPLDDSLHPQAIIDQENGRWRGVYKNIEIDRKVLPLILAEKGQSHLLEDILDYWGEPMEIEDDLQ